MIFQSWKFCKRPLMKGMPLDAFCAPLVEKGRNLALLAKKSDCLQKAFWSRMVQMTRFLKPIFWQKVINENFCPRWVRHPSGGVLLIKCMIYALPASSLFPALTLKPVIYAMKMVIFLIQIDFSDFLFSQTFFYTQKYAWKFSFCLNSIYRKWPHWKSMYTYYFSFSSCGPKLFLLALGPLAVLPVLFVLLLVVGVRRARGGVRRRGGGVRGPGRATGPGGARGPGPGRRVGRGGRRVRRRGRRVRRRGGRVGRGRRRVLGRGRRIFRRGRGVGRWGRPETKNHEILANLGQFWSRYCERRKMTSFIA